MCDDPLIVGQFWYRFTNALQRWLCVSNECWKHGNAFSSKHQIKAVAGGADFAMGIVADCFAGPMCRGGLGSHFDPDFGIGIGRVGRKFDPCGFAACKGCIGEGAFRMQMTTLRCATTCCTCWTTTGFTTTAATTGLLAIAGLSTFTPLALGLDTAAIEIGLRAFGFTATGVLA